MSKTAQCGSACAYVDRQPVAHVAFENGRRDFAGCIQRIKGPSRVQNLIRCINGADFSMKP